MFTGENRPMSAKESQNINFVALSEIFLELVSDSKEARINFIFIFLLNKGG
jgi:hypothetical protein